MNIAQLVVVGCLLFFVLSIFFAVAMFVVRHRKVPLLMNIIPKKKAVEDPMVVLMRSVYDDADAEAFKEVRQDMVHSQSAKRKAELISFFKGDPPTA